MEFEEPETGYARTVDGNSKLEMKKMRNLEARFDLVT